MPRAIDLVRVWGLLKKPTGTLRKKSAISGLALVMIAPGVAVDPPGVAYVYAPDRKADRPIAHLAGFEGILQVDGYAGPSIARC